VVSLDQLNRAPQMRALSHDRSSASLGMLRPGRLAEVLRRCRLLLRDPRE
jgi:hypothetical protein